MSEERPKLTEAEIRARIEEDRVATTPEAIANNMNALPPLLRKIVRAAIRANDPQSR